MLRQIWRITAVMCAIGVGWAADWRSIDPAILKRTVPKLEPDAAAEIIKEEVIIDFVEGQGRLNARHYVLKKIYTDRGASENGDLELPNLPWVKYSDIRARTVQPNGSIQTVERADLIEKEIIRAGRTKIRAKTLALPGVRAGSVIEVSFKEERRAAERYLIYLQHEYPAWETTVSIPFFARFHRFRCDQVERRVEKDRQILQSRDIPAFREEPQMPPAIRSRPWIAIDMDPSLWFQSYGGGAVREWFERSTRADDQLGAESHRIVEGAVGDLEKLRRLEAFCRREIRTMDNVDLEEALEGMRAWKAAKRPRDTLTRRAGTGEEVTFLFAAMARSLGFKPCYARVEDREGPIAQPPDMRSVWYFMPSYEVAVWLGKGWYFVDPAHRWLPAGMLRWQEEQGQAVVFDERGPMTTTPASTSAQSTVLRSAVVELNENGGLTGTAQFHFTGHLAAGYREVIARGKTRQEQIELVQKILNVTDGSLGTKVLRIHNADDVSKELVFDLRINEPSYATRTGRRLMIAPAIFQRGAKPTFTESKRVHPVVFPFSYTETDRVRVYFPPGYELETGASPGDRQLLGVGLYSMMIAVSSGERYLQMTRKREMSLSAGGTLAPEHYPTFKTWADHVHQADQVMVVLRKMEVETTAIPPK